jgi:hypothetical protein
MVAAGCLDERTSSIDGGCWRLETLLGAMWATPLETGAAVSCWRLQLASGPAAFMVAAGCMVGRTSSIKVAASGWKHCWVQCGPHPWRQGLQCHVGGCWWLQTLLGAMWASPLEAEAAVSCWQLQLASGPAALMAAAGCMVGWTSSIDGGYWLLEDRTSSSVGGCWLHG